AFPEAPLPGSARLVRAGMGRFSSSYSKAIIKSRVQGGSGMSIRIAASIPFILSGLLQAAQVCDLTLTACPKQLPSGTLMVPMDVISLDARIPSCRETGTISTVSTPSIVFIIDNSSSMNNQDQSEQRFSVVTSLLDSINATEPGTEVGLVVFTRRLQFDHRDNPLFLPAFPGDTSQHDSYIPLTSLNK